MICPENETELRAVEADGGRYLGYVRAVGRRTAEVKLEAPVAFISTRYARRERLRSIEGRVHAVSFANPPPTLRRVLERRGFRVR